MMSLLMNTAPDRKKYIGGSDVAAILGVSPWRTPLDVYLDKIKPPKEVSAQKKKIFTRGQRMEPYVLDLLEEETGLTIIRRNARHTDPQLPFIAAEIDAEAESGENIEIKTVNAFKAKEWGEVQTDEIPVHYTAQAMHGLMVTGREVCIFGVLIGSDDFRLYRVERDEALITAIREQEIAFWERVQKRNPPPATRASDILRLFDNDSGESIEAGPRALEALNRLRLLQEQKKTTEEQISICEETLKLIMREKTTLTLDGKPLATWKTQKSTRFDTAAFSETHPDLFEAFKTTRKHRVFRLKQE